MKYTNVILVVANIVVYMVVLNTRPPVVDARVGEEAPIAPQAIPDGQMAVDDNKRNGSETVRLPEERDYAGRIQMAEARLRQLQEESGVYHEYGRLLRRIGDSPESVRESLIATLTIIRLEQADAKRIAKQEGYNLSQAAERDLDAYVSRLYDKYIKKILGESGFEKYAEYRRTLGVRYAVNSFSGRVQAIGEPISDELEDRLVEMLASEAGERDAGDRVVAPTVIPSSIIDQVREELSSRQLAALQALQDVQRSSEIIREVQTALSKGEYNNE